MPPAPAIADCSPKYTGVSRCASASRCLSVMTTGESQSRSRDVHCTFAPLWKRFSRRSSGRSGNMRDTRNAEGCAAEPPVSRRSDTARRVHRRLLRPTGRTWEGSGSGGYPASVARIVISTIGVRGDLNPFIAIGKGLQARGHDLVFALEPALHAAVADEGFPFEQLTGDVLHALSPHLGTIVGGLTPIGSVRALARDWLTVELG